MKIPKGYKILVIDPKGLLLGQIELDGKDWSNREERERMIGELQDTLLYGPSGEENKDLTNRRLAEAIGLDVEPSKPELTAFDLQGLREKLGDGLLFAGTPDEFLDMIEGKEG